MMDHWLLQDPDEPMPQARNGFERWAREQIAELQADVKIARREIGQLTARVHQLEAERMIGSVQGAEGNLNMTVAMPPEWEGK